MSNYVPTNWADEAPQASPVRFRVKDSNGNIVHDNVTIEVVTDIIAGTPVNAQNLNHMEQGIKTVQDALNAAIAAGVQDIFQAKGDLAVASAGQAAGRLPVGSTGQALMVDPAQLLGVKWGDINATLKFTVIKKTTTQTIGTGGGSSTLSWDAEDYDDWSGHDNPVNNSRITILETGVYVLVGTFVVTWNTPPASGYWNIYPYKNGSGYAYGFGDFYAHYTARAMSIISPPQPLSAGDYLELKAANNTDQSFYIATSSRFGLIKVR